MNFCVGFLVGNLLQNCLFHYISCRKVAEQAGRSLSNMRRGGIVQLTLHQSGGEGGQWRREGEVKEKRVGVGRRKKGPWSVGKKQGSGGKSVSVKEKGLLGKRVV